MKITLRKMTKPSTANVKSESEIYFGVWDLKEVFGQKLRDWEICRSRLKLRLLINVSFLFLSYCFTY